MLYMLKEGGPVALIYLIPLLCYSILSLAVVLERVQALRMLRRLEAEEFARIRAGLNSALREDVLESLDQCRAPLGAVLRAGLAQRHFGLEHVKEAMGTALAEQAALFGRNLNLLATVGSTAPYIGLFGTVLGILRAFNKIAQQGFGGPSVVAGGIAEALFATAFGLGIAIPAVIAYNVLVGKVNDLSRVVTGHASTLTPHLLEREAIDAGA